MLNVNGKWSSLISPYTQHNFWSLNSLYSNLPIKFSCFFFGNSIHRSSQCVYTFWRNQLIIYIWINLPFNSFVMIRLFTFYFENLSIGPSKKKTSSTFSRNETTDYITVFYCDMLQLHSNVQTIDSWFRIFEINRSMYRYLIQHFKRSSSNIPIEIDNLCRTLFSGVISLTGYLYICLLVFWIWLNWYAHFTDYVFSI